MGKADTKIYFVYLGYSTSLVGKIVNTLGSSTLFLSYLPFGSALDFLVSSIYTSLLLTKYSCGVYSFNCDLEKIVMLVSNEESFCNLRVIKC